MRRACSGECFLLLFRPKTYLTLQFFLAFVFRDVSLSVRFFLAS
jgi:hypothetical protein